MLAPLLAATLLAPLTQKEAEERFFRSWVEVERVRDGVTEKDPRDLHGIDFSPDGRMT